MIGDVEEIFNNGTLHNMLPSQFWKNSYASGDRNSFSDKSMKGLIWLSADGFGTYFSYKGRIIIIKALQS